MIMFTFFLILFVFGCFSYLLCSLEGDFFKKAYNNHILHLTLLFVSALGAFFSSLSLTALDMWRNYKGDVGIVRKTLENIENNISEYSFTEIKFSEVNDNCTLKFVHKATGDRHSIYINNNFHREYIHWYKNGKLVIRNGIDSSINNSQEYSAFHEDIHVCTVLNGFIFNKIEDIVTAARRFNISQNLGDVSILVSEQPVTKTLEVTAPADSTITGAVTEQGQIIYTETL